MEKILTNIRSKNKTVNWPVLIGWAIMSLLGLAIFYSKIESLFGLAFLLIICFVISRILFNLPPEDSFLVIKSWFRSTMMSSYDLKNRSKNISIKKIKNIQKIKTRVRQ